MSGGYAGPEWLRRVAEGVAGVSPWKGSAEIWVVDGKRPRIRGLKVRERAMWTALRLARRWGFPFGGVTVSQHHPRVPGGPGATSINLLWRGRTYEGFLVPMDPRKLLGDTGE